MLYKPHRVSVDELYGRKPKKSDNTIDTKKHVKNDETVDVSPNHVKLTQPPASFAPEILASPSTRIIATLIDWLLFAMIYVPLAFYIPQDAFVPAKDSYARRSRSYCTDDLYFLFYVHYHTKFINNTSRANHR